MDKNVILGFFQLFTGEVLAKTEDAESDVLHLELSGGNIRIQAEVTAGTGTIECEVLESVDGVTYVTNSTPVFSTQASGDSVTLSDFDCKASRFIKILVTEDGGAQPATFTLSISVR